MALNLEGKKEIVDHVSQLAQSSMSLLAADYREMTVAQMTLLRRQAREANVSVMVVRNTLAIRALEGTEFEVISAHLKGPIVLMFAQESLGAHARVLKDFAKKSGKPSVVAMALGGQVYGPEHLDKVASLPTREEALARLCGTLQAPLSKLARTVNEVPSKLARAVAAVRDTKAQAA